MKTADWLNSYRDRYEILDIFTEGKKTHILKLNKMAYFSPFKDCPHDHHTKNDEVLVLEEWFCGDEGYDEILNQFPDFPDADKISHGWFGNYRLCTAIESDNRPHILYVNRDANSGDLFISQIMK